MGHITILKNWITNLEKTIVIEFDLSITVRIYYANLAPFGPNFDFMTSQELLNFQIWKNDRSDFSPQKINMVPSLELSSVVWS